MCCTLVEGNTFLYKALRQCFPCDLKAQSTRQFLLGLDAKICVHSADMGKHQKLVNNKMNKDRQPSYQNIYMDGRTIISDDRELLAAAQQAWSTLAEEYHLIKNQDKAQYIDKNSKCAGLLLWDPCCSVCIELFPKNMKSKLQDCRRDGRLDQCRTWKTSQRTTLNIVSFMRQSC